MAAAADDNNDDDVEDDDSLNELYTLSVMVIKPSIHEMGNRIEEDQYKKNVPKPGLELMTVCFHLYLTATELPIA